MSKWILPSHDGTSPSDQVTRQPLVVRVNGEIGSEQAHSVAKRFEGEISQFYVAQVQKRALSALPVYGAHAAGPGIEMRYRYNHGLEYLDVRVSDEVTTGKLSEVEDFWDYALVEIVLPDAEFAIGAFALICFAHMTSPEETALTAASMWPVDGVASNYLTRTIADPIVNAADSASSFIAATTTADSDAASFTIDLRQSRGGSAVADIYGYMEVRDEVIPNAAIGWAATEFLIYSEIGNPTVPDTKPNFPAEGSLFQSAPLSVTEPTIHFDRTQGTWVFDATGITHYIQDVGYTWDGDIPPFTGPNTSPDTTYFTHQATDDYMIVGTRQRGHGWFFWEIAQLDPYLPAYDGPNPIPAKAYISLFKGVPSLKAIDITGPHASYRRWGFESANLLGPMIVADVMVQAIKFTVLSAPFPSSPGLNVFYHIPKLGSVLLDTHRKIRTRPEIITIASWKTA